MGSLKQVQVVVVVVEIWGCISQKNPLTSSLRTSCRTTRRGGGREEAELVRAQQHHLLVQRELHLNTLPEQLNTHLALRRNKIKQQILKIKESGRPPRIKAKGL